MTTLDRSLIEKAGYDSQTALAGCKSIPYRASRRLDNGFEIVHKSEPSVVSLRSSLHSIKADITEGNH